jgi:hypothetical protein
MVIYAGQSQVIGANQAASDLLGVERRRLLGTTAENGGCVVCDRLGDPLPDAPHPTPVRLEEMSNGPAGLLTGPQQLAASCPDGDAAPMAAWRLVALGGAAVAALLLVAAPTAAAVASMVDASVLEHAVSRLEPVGGLLSLLQLGRLPLLLVLITCVARAPEEQ